MEAGSHLKLCHVIFGTIADSEMPTCTSWRRYNSDSHSFQYGSHPASWNLWNSLWSTVMRKSIRSFKLSTQHVCKKCLKWPL